jgi:tetratricopeptide (TPR) repeat protein
VDGRRSLAAALLLALAAQAAFAAGVGATPGRSDSLLPRARDLLRSGRAAQALDLYRSMHQSDPANVEVRMGLAEAALLSGHHDLGAQIIEMGAASDPANPDWIRLRGMLLASEGKRDEALAVWRSLLEAIPDKEMAYRVTAGLIASEKMLDEAIALLLEGRRALGDTLLFGEDLAPLYDLAGDPAASVVELARAVVANRMTGNVAMARCPSLDGKPEAAAAAAERVRLFAAARPERVDLLDLIAWLRLSSGDCAGANAAAAEADRVSGLCNAHRMSLYGMIRPDAPCEAQTLAAVRQALVTCPPLPEQWPLVRVLAGRLAEAGEYAEARDLLDQTLRGLPQATDDAEEGYLALGAILLDGTREMPKARALYEALSARCSKCPQAARARLGGARAALLLGDFAGAEAAYQEALARATDDATREEALFGLAETRFFAGDFAKAGEDLKRVVTTYPKGRCVNDAVERMIFLGENTDAGEGLLKSYAEAVRLGLSGNGRGAVERLDAIVADFPLSNLRDDAAMEAALVVAWMGEDQAALERLERVATEFPDSPLAPRAVLERARIRWRRLGDVAGAQEECERLLLRYSDNLLADEARALADRLARLAKAETRG